MEAWRGTRQFACLLPHPQPPEFLLWLSTPGTTTGWEPFSELVETKYFLYDLLSLLNNYQREIWTKKFN